MLITEYMDSYLPPVGLEELKVTQVPADYFVSLPFGGLLVVCLSIFIICCSPVTSRQSTCLLSIATSP